VVLRHIIEHRKQIWVDTISPELPLAIDVIGPDDTQTIVTLQPASDSTTAW
jgi:hypothetical protein